MAHVPAVALSLKAMATRFELLLYGDDPTRLRAAGEEALGEIERLESQLSFYRSDSEVRWINQRAAFQPVRIDPRLFRLLEKCAELTTATDGAFDITVGPLMRAWKFVGEGGAMPSREDLEAARERSGMHLISFDEDTFSISFARPGVEIDLGGYGKGYAIERAVELLRENGVKSALLHGGTSSVYGIGTPAKGKSWKVALSRPFPADPDPPVATLDDRALSVSAVHGKSFDAGGRQYGHVIDPRTGRPVSRALAAAVAGQSPSVCEALSKALLVHGPAWLIALEERFPGYQASVAFLNDVDVIEQSGNF
ncbi:MAG: FAD:protein FMN transferase [Acidobacteria bacterium]|nr:FAD:protein FMN transferase [Acidobacteriota bacterium]